MPAKHSGRILLKFPFRNPAGRTYLNKPFISQPSTCPAVQRVVNDEFFITMDCQFCSITGYFYGSDAVEPSFPGRPEFDFINKVKQPCPLPVESFLNRGCFFGRHCVWHHLATITKNGGESGSRTRLHGFRVHVISSDPPSAFNNAFQRAFLTIFMPLVFSPPVVF